MKAKPNLKCHSVKFVGQHFNSITPFRVTATIQTVELMEKLVKCVQRKAQTNHIGRNHGKFMIFALMTLFPNLKVEELFHYLGFVGCL